MILMGMTQVSTQQGNNVAEALTFVPNAAVKDVLDDSGALIGRELIYWQGV